MEKKIIEKRESYPPEGCDHVCTSNCRREGCNCECGEWHGTYEEDTSKLSLHPIFGDILKQLDNLTIINPPTQL